MLRRHALTLTAASVALVAGSLFTAPAFAQDTIKVGVLDSLSGTMAISEAVL